MDIYTLIGYLLFINLIAFISFGLDKRKAIKGKWRTPEATLLSFSLIGGGLGSYIGMKFFHHKTKKMKFKIFVPLNSLIFVILLVSYFILIDGGV